LAFASKHPLSSVLNGVNSDLAKLRRKRATAKCKKSSKSSAAVAACVRKALKAHNGKKGTKSTKGKKAAKSHKGKKAKGKKGKKCPHGYPGFSSFNPHLYNNLRSSDSDSCPNKVTDGRNVCAARPSLLLKVNGVETDHWMTDKPIARYQVRPGQAPRVKQASVERQPGAELYFASAPIRRIKDENGNAREMVFTWVRSAGPGYLPLDSLPGDVANAVRAKATRCGISRQSNHACVKRPSYRGRSKRCHFRSSNPSGAKMNNLLKYGFVFPRPNLKKGSLANTEDVLSHYMLRPMQLYNIALNLPAKGSASIAHDFVTAGDPFWIHPSKKASVRVPVFFAGEDCPKTFLKWVYGAPASQDDANKPDWSRAGWTPLATLQC